jgi:3-oxoacyl-[acyl-carrier protein] reductase
MNVAKSVCVVTGAGRGLGYELATDLARRGARVYACDVSETALAKLREDAQREGWPVTCEACDVTDEAAVQDYFARIGAAGGLDVLVNNAGITRDGLLVRVKDGAVSRMPLSDFERVLRVNLTGVFLCGREAAALMATRDKGGVIVNISSVSRAGNFGQTNYSASKAGVDAMTVAWSKELARYRIRVAAVAPGYLRTEMVAALKPEALERIVNQVPLKRLGEPAEIAATVRFIIENDFVTGRVLEVDGGLRV